MNRIVTGLRNTALLISMCIFASTPLTIYGAETGTTAAPAAATTAAAPAATTPTEEAAQTGTTASTEAPAAAQAAEMTPQEKIEAATRHLEGISEDDTTIRIMLDPGHGGEDSGASGNGLSEKKVTLIIGKALMKELQKYDNVLVGMVIFYRIHLLSF